MTGTTARRLAAGVLALVMVVALGACKPKTGTPVVIVGGFSGLGIAYTPLEARLEADGFDARIFELPGLGTGDIADSAAALDTYVDGLLAETGASKVDIVAHSEGGLVARYYTKYLGGDTEVWDMVTLGSPHYGTPVANVLAFYGWGTCFGIVACQQMTVGSTFLDDLNEPDDSVGNTRYTAVSTFWDELVQPEASAQLVDDATNVSISTVCPLRVVDHPGLVIDGAVYSLITQALDRDTLDADCFAL